MKNKRFMLVLVALVSIFTSLIGWVVIAIISYWAKKNGKIDDKEYHQIGWAMLAGIIAEVLLVLFIFALRSMMNSLSWI